MEIITTKEKINRAFKELKERGYFAEQDFWCCQSCGWAAVPDENSDRAVFYHAQDADAFEGNELRYDLYLAWSGDPIEIRNVLEKNGLRVEHEGSENTRIRICKTMW